MINFRSALFGLACAGGLFLAAPVAAQTVAGPYEYDDYCYVRIPEAISFVRENVAPYWQAPNWQVSRDVKFPGVPSTRMVPAWGKSTAKNPEGSMVHAPGQFQNCTPSANPNLTQWLSFKVKGTNYFNGAPGNHIAIMLRATFPTYGAEGNEQYEGLGLILTRVSRDNVTGAWTAGSGVFGERYQNKYENGVRITNWNSYIENGNFQMSPQHQMHDVYTYQVTAHAAPTHVAYWVTIVETGQTLSRVFYQPSGYAPLYSTGLGFVPLCDDLPSASCEAYNEPFRVDIWDITGGWF